jgi:hypothetical protein
MRSRIKEQSKMLNMKKFMCVCMAITTLGNIAMADYTLPAVPKKFQAAWICAEGGAPTTISTNTVSFGGPSDKLKLISIEPGDEELNTVIVKWSTNPGVNVIAKIWKLIKLNGQQFLMDVNYESPTFSNALLEKKVIIAARPSARGQDADDQRDEDDMRHMLTP